MSEFTFSGLGTIERVEIKELNSGKTIKTLVVHTEGKYPQDTPITVFGKLADVDFHKGDVVFIRGRLGGREYQGKYYPDVVAVEVDVIASNHEAKERIPKGKQKEDPLVAQEESNDDVPW